LVQGGIFLSEPRELERFDTLLSIIERLRGPGGCPWDREQTHISLRENLLEESYEALEALDAGNSEQLCGELGDLLMQIIFHAQIARETGEFDIGDVIRNINAKLIRRHPHIFGEVKVNNAEDVARNWEAIKDTERPEGTSALQSAPKSMPALAYSREIQERVARLGFDWPGLEGVIDKVAEEVGELKDAPDKVSQAEEFGDLLFTMVSVARWLGIDPEIALREANRKFFKRFTWMEAICRERGLDFGRLSFTEQNVLWEEAKKATGG
jgi:tetrapyrrole methylase family protein/MazG family protein